jgi:hypothetical protein
MHAPVTYSAGGAHGRRDQVFDLRKEIEDP